MESQLIGAGVVPFYRGRGGEPYFIFGRERAEEHWRASHKLSSFGGASHAGETAAVTAARELREESLCAFPTEGLEADLGGDAYALRIIIQTTRRGATARHVTYVKEVPPGCAWRARFEGVRRQQLLVGDLLREWHDLHGWLGAQGNAHLKMPRLDQGMVELQFAQHAMHMRVVAQGGVVEETVYHTQWISPATLRAYVRWCGVGQRLSAHRESLAGACAGALDDDYRFDDAFLEIDAVQEWSYLELQNLFTNHLAHIVFRHEFMPVLRTLLHEFAPRHA